MHLDLLIALSTLTMAFVPIVGYPVVAWAIVRLCGPRPTAASVYRPSVDLIVVTTASDELIRRKLDDISALTYSRDRLRTILSVDGSLAGSEELVASFDDELLLLESGERVGKNRALNEAVRCARGEILVFSDVDARLDPDAVERLCDHFADAAIGGVCGQRVIEERVPGLLEPQRSYVRFDSWIKRSESSCGSITSNDGKLYAMRRGLFVEIPAIATDDLFNCLSVVLQGRRFVYARDVHAHIPKPSRGFRHEVERRRRIVGSSLSGIFERPAVLVSSGLRTYGFRLVLNKVVRRLIPVLLLISFGASVWGASHHIVLRLLTAAYLGLLGLTLVGLSFGGRLPRGRCWTRLVTLAAYLAAGSVGTVLGLVDLLRGKGAIVWEPRKSG